MLIIALLHMTYMPQALAKAKAAPKAKALGVTSVTRVKREAQMKREPGAEDGNPEQPEAAHVLC